MDIMNKKIENTEIHSFVFFFFLMPLYLSSAFITLFTGNLTHISTGIKFEGFQARGIAIIFIMISCYVLYQLLYKIPLFNNGLLAFHSLRKKMITSVFFYLFLLKLLYPFFGFYYRMNNSWVINIALLIICWVAQYYFFNNTKQYIYQPKNSSH